MATGIETIELNQRLQAAADALEAALKGTEQVAAVEPLALQRTLAAAMRLFVARLEQGDQLKPLPPREIAPPPTATETLVVVGALLDAHHLEPFELGGWQLWGGIRP